MKRWQKVWHDGFAPLMPTKGLESLAQALADDDSRLLQGGTVTPPPLECVRDCPAEAACAIGFCGWKGLNLENVAEVEEFFTSVCLDVDQRLGERAACRWFLNWFDETPRKEMRRQLLEEVNRTLERRLDHAR